MAAPRSTVLLVDDELNVCAALRRVIRPIGCRVLTASNGREALAVLEEHDVDVVITDMRMPVMDGFELLQIVTARFPGVVRVLLTGYADLSVTTRAIREGLTDHFLVKPWEPDEIAARVREAIGAPAEGTP